MTPRATQLLPDRCDAINIGIELFADELVKQGAPVQRTSWRPPPPPAARCLAELAWHSRQITRANTTAVDRIQEAKPVLVGVGTAGQTLRDMTKRTILHAGPRIAWSDMSGPLRGAIIGAALYEGVASSKHDAIAQAKNGALEFGSCHDRDAVGPMAGVISHSMPVWIVENELHGNRAYCTLNEGLGAVLRFGAFGAAVIARLRWMERVLGPLLDEAIKRRDQPIDLRGLTAQALQMGDDGHNRTRAGTMLLLRELLPVLMTLEARSDDLRDAVRFISGNEHFYLNLSMAAAKATTDAAAGVDSSTIITAMSRNGTEFGVRASGTGDRWFLGSAPVAEGLFLPGYDATHANRDIGDSSITETAGIGAFAMAAAPAISNYIGISATQASHVTERMYDITWSESRIYKIPALEFRGTPVGIDARYVIHSQIAPIINTGIAHKEPGIGQIGAGLVEAPLEVFLAAARALAAELHRQPLRDGAIRTS